MNLRNLANIFKRNTKTGEKSIHSTARIDIFLLVTLFIVIITPFVIMLINKISADIRLVNLYLSPGFEELFGKDMTESLLREFNEVNSDIRVRLLTANDIRNGKEADIVIYYGPDPSIESALAGLNFLVNDPSQHPITAIPLVSFMDVLFYNIDALASAGFIRPPRTKGEYQTYSKTVEDSGIYSDDIFEPENNRPMNRKLEDFAQGKAAMIIASTQAIPSLRKKMGDDAFGITTIPYAADGTVGRYSINLTGIYAGIGINSEYIDAAWSFIEFLTEQSAVFCEIFKAVPGVISDIIPGDYIHNDPFYSKAWDIFEYNQLTDR
jgi:ABC-type glycerol-3-phosphate transport system substrate-binding protein